MLADVPARLTLADLEAFDPGAPERDGERRFCCPLPACGDKPRDRDHRSLSVNTATGLWRCWRCQVAGKLQEFWTDRPSPRSRRERQAAAARRAFSVTPQRPAAAPVAPPATEPESWRVDWDAAPLVADTPGAAYLAGRGIPLDIATAAGVRWLARFCGRPAVGFPVVNRAGELVAINGRYTDGRTDPKTRTAGPKSLGVFATADALEAAPLVIVEAPIDALALAACGVPAMALVGTSAPAWLSRHAALREVLIGLDGDEAGDVAAGKLARQLSTLGARCERLRPSAKDWADALQQLGREMLSAQLAALVQPPPIPAVVPLRLRHQQSPSP